MSDSNKLNLFKFAQKRKGSTSSVKSKKRDSQLPSQLDSPQDPHDVGERLQIETNEPDDSFPPESYMSSTDDFGMSPIQSPSENSLIFERSVEDPAQVYQQNQCPRCGQKSNSNGPTCNHQSIVNLPSHYSVENFTSPCLDATTRILTDKNADLENVDMVYSRRPSSVMGLNLALGRTRSSVTEPTSPQQPPVSKTHSLANFRDLGKPFNENNTFSSASVTGNNNNNTDDNTNNNTSTTPARPPALSFYSYADMINNENPNPRRPSMSQSLSSSFINSRLNSRSNSVSQNSNFNAGSSITPQRAPLSSRQQSFSSPFIVPTNSNANSTTSNYNAKLHQQRTNSLSQKKFILNPDNSPNSSDSESDYIHSTNSRKNSVNSRKSKNLSKTISNTSSLHSSSMTPNRRYSNLDDTLYNASDNESLVVSSIGERIRRNTGEIKSSNNSIIA